MPDTSGQDDNDLESSLMKAIGWINLMRGFKQQAQGQGAKPAADDPYGDQQKEIEEDNREEAQRTQAQGQSK